MMVDNNKRRNYDLLRAQLENERSTFMNHWRELGDNIQPRRTRFTTSDINKGDRRNSKIIDSTATLAARTLRSGMMSGVTSPARPWFRLTTPDPSLSEIGSVKDWLYLVQQRMSTVFLKSNIYNILPILYGDLGVFGTGCMAIEEDFTGDVIRCYSFPIGSYMVANNDRMKVDVFIREFRMTVRQLIDKFGDKDAKGNIDWTRFSVQVKSLYDNNQREVWIDVVHIIKPNDAFDPRKAESRYKKYSSCYFEQGSYNAGVGYLSPGGSNENTYLKESGYDYFPILCPRWETTGEDVYGTSCPGMEALGDIKQLQVGERRAAEAIEKMVRPPMNAPTSMMTSKASILPGDINFVDVREGMQGFVPAYQVNPRIQELEGKQAQVRERIKRCFYEDLFLMMANSDRRDITAREIDERHEEKLLAIGPVLEQLNQDLLDPAIDITFNIMQRQGLIPPAPTELQGMELKVEYISVMAQAQNLIGIAGIERFMSFAGQVMQTDSTVADKVDRDQVLDIYGDMTSVPPGIIRPDEQVAQIRQQRAQQQQAQQQMAAMQQGAATAKDLSQTQTGGDNALTRLIQDAKAGQLEPTQGG